MSEAQFVYIAVAIDPAGSQCIDYAYKVKVKVKVLLGARVHKKSAHDIVLLKQLYTFVII